MVAGRRFGKTTLAVNELLQSAIKNPSSLQYYIAPTYRQAKEIAWRMLKNIVPVELIIKVNESELSVELTNGSKIELKGCDNPDSLRGVGVSFIVVDEFAVIPNAENLWIEVLRPMLIDTKGRGLFIGTPKGLNAFYTFYHKGVEGLGGFKSFRYTTYDNPFLEKAEIDVMKAELHPTIFEQEVMASFLVSGENTLIKLEYLEAIKGIHFYDTIIGDVISCDPSLGGDECVIYVMHNSVILESKYMYERDTMKIVGELMILSAKYHINNFAVDAIGIGQGIVDRLGELKKNAIAIRSSEKSSYKKQLYNKRAEMYWYVMERIMNKELPYPEEEELRRQLTSVQYKVINSNGLIQLEPKSDTKKRLGRSPDRADAYIYGIWATQFLDERNQFIKPYSYRNL